MSQQARSCRRRRSRGLLSHRLSAVSTAAPPASTYGPSGHTARRNQSYRSCETRSGGRIRTSRPFTIAASICVAQNQPATFGAGPEYEGVSGSFSLDGNIHEEEICLFPRRSALSLEQIRSLANSHPRQRAHPLCQTVDQGSNTPGARIETPFCDGNCNSVMGGTPGSSRVRRSIGLRALTPRAERARERCGSQHDVTVAFWIAREEW